MATRIAIISDTHLSAAHDVPAACADLIAGSDLALHAGDVSTAEVLAAIKAIGPPVHAVRGNVDEPTLRRTLPEEFRLTVDGVRLAIVHDAGAAAGRILRMRRQFPDVDAVVFGHSHMPLHEEAQGFQIFNPGSPTQRRRAPHRSIGIADVNGGEIRFRHLAL